MVAAENGALPGGKVGGIGDVIRDLPVALAARGWEPTVLTPAYGVFAGLPGAAQSARLQVPFGGAVECVGVFDVPGPDRRVRHRVLEHPLFCMQGPGRIYCDDGPDRPFYSDGGKFALLCAAAAELAASRTERPQVMHLHDWHAGLFFALRRFAPRYAALRSVRAVLSVHNLAFQGTRPLQRSGSSLEAWFPRLSYQKRMIVDPRHRDCVNPLAAAIRMADKVHTVSPTYAHEILRPSAPEAGFVGGEGLEADLTAAAARHRLVGILNGCAYPATTSRRPGWKKLVKTLEAALVPWVARSEAVPAAHYVADKRLAGLPAQRPTTVLTSVGRVTDQKVRLFRERVDAERSALDAVLELLGDGGVLIMLGSGEPAYERFFCETAARHANFVFLRGYSDALAESLYAAGDLFLMPSSFEPCGISQMLAMRAGQPCVVHAVGGLKDTVDPGCGFLFDGAGPAQQARSFVAAVQRALTVQRTGGAAWQKMRRAAAAKRFTWEAAAARLERELYGAARRDVAGAVRVEQEWT
jgi:starch synthase